MIRALDGGREVRLGDYEAIFSSDPRFCERGGRATPASWKVLEWVESTLPARVAELRQSAIKHRCDFSALLLVPLLGDSCKAFWVSRFLPWALAGVACSKTKAARPFSLVNLSTDTILEAKRNQRTCAPPVNILSFQYDADEELIFPLWCVLKHLPSGLFLFLSISLLFSQLLARWLKFQLDWNTLSNWAIQN